MDSLKQDATTRNVHRETRDALNALRKAEEALSVLRSQYENHGEWYEGWASNALPVVREAIAEIEKKIKQ